MDQIEENVDLPKPKKRRQLTPEQRAVYNANRRDPIKRAMESARKRAHRRDPAVRAKRDQEMAKLRKAFNSKKFNKVTELAKLRLIKSVEKYPIIYQESHPQYKDPNLTLDAWELVAKETNAKVDACRQMWKIVRNNYNRTMRRTQRNTSYYLENHLKFLDPTSSSKEPGDQFCDHRKQFLISMLPDVRLLTYRQMILFKNMVLKLIESTLKKK